MYNAETHFKNLYDTVPRAFEFRATTREELLAWQANFRPKLREILGLDNMEVRSGRIRPEGGTARGVGYG